MAPRSVVRTIAALPSTTLPESDLEMLSPEGAFTPSQAPSFSGRLALLSPRSPFGLPCPCQGRCRGEQLRVPAIGGSDQPLRKLPRMGLRVASGAEHHQAGESRGLYPSSPIRLM